MPTYDRHYFTFYVDNAWLEGSIEIKDFSNVKALIHELSELFKELNIVKVDKAALKKILQEKKTNQRYVVARGQKPEAAHPEYYELLIDLSEKPRPMEKMDGGVDFKELYIPNLVKENRPLLRKIPAYSGKPGYNIKGQVLEPVEQKIVTFIPSEDLIPSDSDPNIFVASKAGLVKIEDKKVVISTKFHIPGDVDYSTGNIDFPGDVVVQGDVKSGFRIKATGNVEVRGTVEDATIITEGSVVLKKGFVGNGEGYIKAANDVVLGYGLNQTIECENLTFHKELINCTVVARNSVVSRRGLIIGGNIKARYKVEVRQIGHEEATKAIISVGSKKDLMRRKYELETKVKELNEEYKKIKENLYELFKKKLRKSLTPEEEKLIVELEQKRKVIPTEVEQMEKNLTELNKAFEKIKNANITVFGEIYPGNVIELFGERLAPNESYKSVMIRYEDDELKILKL